MSEPSHFQRCHGCGGLEDYTQPCAGCGDVFCPECIDWCGLEYDWDDGDYFCEACQRKFVESEDDDD